MTQLATKTSIPPASTLSVSYISAVAGTEPDKKYIADAIVITDAHFNIKGFNDAAAEMYGFSANPPHGQQLFKLVQFELIGTTLSLAIKELFRKSYWNGDVIYYHKDKRCVFSTCCNLIKDVDGQPDSIIISTHNISERLQQQKELVIAENKYQTLVESLSEGVMLINADGTIGAANKKAAEILRLDENEIVGKVLNSLQWKATREDGSPFPKSAFPAEVTLRTGRESNNVVIGLEHINGRKKIWISVNSRAIFEEHTRLPSAAVISFVEITEIREINERLTQSELLFRTFMKNSPTIGWIYDEEGVLVYGNPKFMDIIGLPADTTGKNIASFTHSEEVLATILKRNTQVLQGGKPLIIEEEIADKDGNNRYYLSYWFLLPNQNSRQLIGGHAVEITDKKKAQKEIDKMYERYHFAINASFNAIWDMDITTGSIYRSDAFIAFTGYEQENIVPSLEWFIGKIHEQDQKRIKTNVEHCLKNNVINWENEYRFQIADGSYRNLLDKAHAIYVDGKLTRVIGSMQDITERKRLEAQLLHEQVQKQKMINQATITAQEKERNRISGELHDNVNQLIMSAKLHVCVAKNRAEAPSELLEKANDYLLMAVEEIRGLSKTLTSTLISHVGLQKSISDIGASMLLLKNIQLHTYIREDVVARLSPEQQLMVYRIIQEQSNNILKYAETDEAIISLKQVNQQVELIISDNGKGFDKAEQKATGIGFINIFNRVDAYNGKVDIITTPGNGCTLIITFPITETAL